MHRSETIRIRTNALQDYLFLILVFLLSIALYVAELGFYSDDWAFLGTMSTSSDQSFTGLFNSLFHNHDISMRPVEWFFKAATYRLFGPVPLGYHAVNSFVMLSTILLFYLVLRELRVPRILSLTVPLLYSLLPHYSADRFWITTAHINISMSLYFLSLFTVLKALYARRGSLLRWKLLSLVSLICSVLAYELVLPLFFLNLFLIWYWGNKLNQSDPTKHIAQTRLMFLLAINLFVLMVLVAFKMYTTQYLFVPNENKTNLWLHMISIIKRAFSLGEYDYGLNIKQAILVNYGDYGVGLPLVVWKIVRDCPNLVIFTGGLTLGLLVYAYLYFAVTPRGLKVLIPTFMLKVSALGIVVFGLGYAIFLTNDNIFLTVIGVHNRVNLSAALGVSISLVGLTGLATTVLSSDVWRKSVFCTLVAVLCTFGYVIINTLASYWTTAYRHEVRILAEIRSQLLTLPNGSTLILDGICPSVGPAIVFNSSWDIAGALQMMYNDSTIKADVVTPYLKVEQDAIYTSLNLPETRYPYKKLFVYDFDRNTMFPLTSASSANQYFQNSKMYHNMCTYHINECRQPIKGLESPVF